MATKQFERPENTNPNMAQRFAFGRAGNITENMTLTNFVIWITSKLSFLKIASNLSDLNDKAISRTNLDVNSKGEITTLLSGKEPTLINGDVLPCTTISSYIDAGSFICNVVRYGNLVVGTGHLTFNSLPAPNTPIINLPAGYPVPKLTTYIVGGSGTGIGRETFGMEISASGSQFVFNFGDNGYSYYFGFSYVI